MNLAQFCRIGDDIIPRNGRSLIGPRLQNNHRVVCAGARQVLPTVYTEIDFLEINSVAGKWNLHPTNLQASAVLK